MKTDLVEIFQTIRAGVQPYATRGYTVHENSETGYDLYSEKNIETAGEKITERFFIGIYINGGVVEVKLNAEDFTSNTEELKVFSDDKIGYEISEIDDQKLSEVQTFVEIIHTHFKEKEWI
ncbi:hypothetical protein GJU39_07035 [Pedobacter petrophilus]|uniref:DUF1801 domain-containing protein n=1 Tax=Pedobacter petrophilus TaxID=1908241 RepID=A0A7K0FY09_9SPHI|nr:hypothetical protein [Pedobacter petrophilus]MRX75839.1 hypothetical protein [Pedobacter petrophilus]